MHPIVMIIYGYPGVGKTTFAKKLENNIESTVRLSNDEIRKEMSLPLIGIQNTTKVYKEAAKKAFHAIEKYKIPIFDATFYLSYFREIIYDHLEIFSPYYLFIKLKAPIEICRERVITRENNIYNGVNSTKIFDKIISEFEEIHDNEISKNHLVFELDIINKDSEIKSGAHIVHHAEVNKIIKYIKRYSGYE